MTMKLVIKRIDGTEEEVCDLEEYGFHQWNPSQNDVSYPDEDNVHQVLEAAIKRTQKYNAANYDV